VSLASVSRPTFWIVAGPNGSGKSTLYGQTDIEGFGRSVWITNPDLLTARLRVAEGLAPEAANGTALDRIWDWLQASIDAHQTVGVETVLSTDKYRGLVLRAKKRGFEFRLLFVTLRTAEQNIERVRLRVAQGGHDVPEEKLRSRRERSFEQLPWFLDQADFALIYDNSGAAPTLIGQKVGGLIEIDPRAPQEIKAAIDTIKD
jgi:predicted ABC-type ATPase